MELIDVRQQALAAWLNTLPMTILQQQAMVGDASFRRYFRISTTQGSFVAMDAPPTQESCQSFVTLAKVLRDGNVLAPEIVAQDVHQGFLLLTDFGEVTYLKALIQNHDEADRLYQNALSSLSKLQACRHASVQPFTREWMWQEMRWWQEWFLGRYLHISYAEWASKIDPCLQHIIAAAVAQPQVLMHRDFHSANLMVLPHPQVGILDFQDAFIGPVTYDLVSLLRDCYIAWPEENVQQWVLSYWQRLRDIRVITADAETFLRWFDWMGIERHLKALFTFARKHVRDNASHYLQHIPRTLHYLTHITARYPELEPLHFFLQEIVLPRHSEVQLCVP